MITDKPIQIDDNGRNCATCGGYKTWDNYYKHPRCVRGHLATCKACQKVARLEKYYAPVGNQEIRQNSVEWSVLKAVALNPDLTNAQLSRKFNCHIDSIKSYIRSLNKKLGSSSAKVLVAYYWHCHYQGRVLTTDEFWSLQKQRA